MSYSDPKNNPNHRTEAPTHQELATGSKKPTLHRLRRSTDAFLGGMSNRSPDEPSPSPEARRPLPPPPPPLSSSLCRTYGAGEGGMLSSQERWHRVAPRDHGRTLSIKKRGSQARAAGNQEPARVPKSRKAKNEQGTQGGITTPPSLSLSLSLSDVCKSSRGGEYQGGFRDASHLLLLLLPVLQSFVRFASLWLHSSFEEVGYGKKKKIISSINLIILIKELWYLYIYIKKITWQLYIYIYIYLYLYS